MILVELLILKSLTKDTHSVNIAGGCASYIEYIRFIQTDYYT